MDGFWQGRGGRLLRVALVVGLLAVALALLIPDHPTGDLGGTEWTLVAYGPPGALTPAEAPASISFAANGRLGGFTGCNQFSGNFRAEDGQWEMVDGELARTLAVCEPDTPAGALDAFFWESFSDGNYTRTAERLTLYFDDGQIAEFTPTL